MINDLNLQMPVPVGSIDAYIGAVGQFPMLSLEEEQDLAQRFQNHEDLDAAKQLVLSHLRFVVRVARGYSGYGLPIGDLIQEGNIGLMKAVKRFDPTVGVRLVSFAVHWVRAEMHEFIIRNWRIVKIATTKAQRKLFFNLRSSKKRLGWMDLGEIEALAEDLGVTKKDVLVMEERLNARDAAFDMSSNKDEEGTAPADYLADDKPEPSFLLASLEQTELRSDGLSSAMAALDERSRDIITRRWLTDSKETLHELAGKYHISAERIRQLEKNAMKKLKGEITALLPAPAG